MQKRRIFAALLAVALLTAVSCQRKGTGCPTFGKAPVEQAKQSI